MMKFEGRPQLSSVFSSWLKSMAKSYRVSNHYMSSPYSGSEWDDDLPIDFDDVVFPFANESDYYEDDVNEVWRDYFSAIRQGKSSKKNRIRMGNGEKAVKSRRERYRNKMRDMGYFDHEYDDGYDDLNDGGLYDTSVRIKYYEDPSDVYSTEEFRTLVEFDKFCDDNGFTISECDANDIAYCTEYHCCLSPYDKEHGRLYLVGGPTYTDMMDRYDYLSAFVTTKSTSM